ncbi:MAG: hypothetical protein IPP56_11150 [Bacteroidetes bacterium]|nr:hypothetical protein [Bacteroidota bacterium]MBK9800228.1 hypothetical protein [Bacteroidota bacterium]
MKKIVITIIALIISFGCNEPSKKQTGGVVINATPKENKPSKKKSDFDIAKEVADTVLGIGKKMLDNRAEKKMKDLEGRIAIWSYQIGVQYDNENALLKDYAILKTIPGISIFKKSPGDLFIIKKGDSEEQLKLDYPAFKASVDKLGILNNSISIVNLSNKCRKGIEVDYIKHNRKQYDCFACK